MMATATDALAAAKLAAIAAALLAAWYVIRNARQVGTFAGQAAAAVPGVIVDAAKGAAVGVTTEASSLFGITPPSLTITDTDRCREYLGQYGYLAASERCSAGAFLGATVKGPTYYGNEGRPRP